MGPQRTVARPAPIIERRPPPRPTPAPQPSRAPTHPVQAMQQRLGNQGTQALLSKPARAAPGEPAPPDSKGDAVARAGAGVEGKGVAPGTPGVAVAKPAGTATPGAPGAEGAKPATPPGTEKGAGGAPAQKPVAGPGAPGAPAPGKEAPAKEEQPAPNPYEAIAPATDAVRKRAAVARRHKPAGVAVDSAQAAAITPSTEQQRLAAAKTVSGMDEAKTEAVRRNEFKEKLRKAVQDATREPKTEAEANRVMKQGAV